MNNCDNCKHRFCAKSEKMNRVFVLCDVKGFFYDTAKCEYFEQNIGKSVESKNELTNEEKGFVSIAELMWNVDSTLNLFNPDYGKSGADMRKGVKKNDR